MSHAQTLSPRNQLHPLRPGEPLRPGCCRRRHRQRLGCRTTPNVTKVSTASGKLSFLCQGGGSCSFGSVERRDRRVPSDEKLVDGPFPDEPFQTCCPPESAG